MIFMTSNLGAAEMSALVSPKFGFGASEQAQQVQIGAANTDLDEKITRTGVAAARRRFTPEFINRIRGTRVEDLSKASTSENGGLAGSALWTFISNKSPSPGVDRGVVLSVSYVISIPSTHGANVERPSATFKRWVEHVSNCVEQMSSCRYTHSRNSAQSRN
jgi:hypothetical protein